MMRQEKNYDRGENTVPDIVEEKCRQAYAQIRQEAAADKRSHHQARKRIITITAIATASVLGVTLAAPTVASTAAFQAIYSRLSDTTTADVPNSQSNTNVTSVSIVQTAENGILNIDAVYFNGIEIAVQLMLTDLPEELQDCTGLTPKMQIQLGEQILESSTGVEEFYPCEGGFCCYFVATYNGDPASTELLPLKVTLDSYTGYNAANWHQDETGEYVPETFEERSMQVQMETQVTVQDDLETIYNIDASTGSSFHPNFAIITPFLIQISIDGEFGEYHQLKVTDQDGVEYEMLGTDNTTIDYNNAIWEPPLTSSKTLQVSVIRLDEVDFPAECTFSIPIEQGYRPPNRYANTGLEYTYTPPLENDTADSDVEYAKLSVANPNDPSDVLVCHVPSQDDTVPNSDDSFVMVRPITCTIADPEDVPSMVQSYNDGEWYEWTREHPSYYEGFAFEDLEMLLVEYEITNCSCDASVFNISSLDLVTKDSMIPSCVNPEVVYVDTKDHDGKAAYEYDFETNGVVRTLTVGYLVTPEALKNGFYCYDKSVSSDVNHIICSLPDPIPSDFSEEIG